MLNLMFVNDYIDLALHIVINKLMLGVIGA